MPLFKTPHSMLQAFPYFGGFRPRILCILNSINNEIYTPYTTSHN